MVPASPLVMCKIDHKITSDDLECRLLFGSFWRPLFLSRCSGWQRGGAVLGFCSTKTPKSWFQFSWSPGCDPYNTDQPDSTCKLDLCNVREVSKEFRSDDDPGPPNRFYTQVVVCPCGSLELNTCVMTCVANEKESWPILVEPEMGVNSMGANCSTAFFCWRTFPTCLSSKLTGIRLNGTCHGTWYSLLHRSNPCSFPSSAHAV